MPLWCSPPVLGIKVTALERDAKPPTSPKRGRFFAPVSDTPVADTHETCVTRSYDATTRSFTFFGRVQRLQCPPGARAATQKPPTAHKPWAVCRLYAPRRKYEQLPHAEVVASQITPGRGLHAPALLCRSTHVASSRDYVYSPGARAP